MQFTVLQEVIAGWLDLEVGSYDHLSDSLHVYEDNFGALKELDGWVEIAPNTGSLRLPKEESDEAFAALEKRLDAMTDDRLTEGRMRELVESDGLPEAFKNLLRTSSAFLQPTRRVGEAGPACQKPQPKGAPTVPYCKYGKVDRRGWDHPSGDWVAP